MNKAIIIGRLTRDPELKFIAGSDKSVCNFSLAVNRPFDKNTADFFRIIVWGKVAENCSKYLEKGRLVAVEGRIQNNNYEKNGVKQFSVDIVAERVDFLERGDKKQSADVANATDGFVPYDDDDLPF